MTRVRTVISERIFVASPNDMHPYRKMLDSIVKNLNANLLAKDQRELVLRTAMKDVAASINGEDPQFVINEGIADKYEFIIVILGVRAGAATPRDITGTIEEFRRAEARNKKGGNPVIMVYFCRDMKDPFELDAEQLKLVHEFRDSIQNKGLFKTFKGKTAFKAMVENDLRLHLLDRIAKVKKITPRDAKKFED